VNWRPTLPASPDVPLYQRLVEAMTADLERGALTPRTRLPPQRELAHVLSISVGAVTRAYDEAARRGLVSAHVGRGTFVSERPGGGTGQDGPIDLSVNIAPIQTASAVARAIAGLRRRPDWAERIAYSPPCGLDVDRQAGAAWLSRTAGFGGLDWRNLLCCAGAQNAMAIAFAALCRPGETVLCEAASYPGMKTLAALMDYRLRGIDLDEQGVDPQALDRAAAETEARVFYTVPTLQNPTARTMDQGRRADIVKVARARGLWIVEDDLYAPYAADLGLSPIATLAPERTLYVSSLSKILSPGLRAGYLVAPPGEVFDRCVGAVRALMLSPASIGAAIATHWIESRQADAMARDVVAEAQARTDLARVALGDVVQPSPVTASLHLWLAMREIEAERVVVRASSAGLTLTSPSAFAVSDRDAPGGLRLCIGGAANRPTLERALAILKRALSGAPDDRARALV
jgi:DNA-binding transcriptional MocR family regulator